MAISYLAAAALATTVLAAQSELPREVLLLARIKQHARQALGRIPNYTCLETAERSVRTRRTRDFQRLDTLRVEVAVVNGKELLSSPGARNFEDRDVADFVGGGLVGVGMFALQWRNIFAGDLARFEYAGEEDLAGRHTVHYRYYMSQLTSGYHLSDGSRDAVVPCHGSFWVDSATLDLLRIDVVADDIPPDLDMADVFTAIDYAPVRIGASKVLLPQTSDMSVTHRNGTAAHNRIEYTHCRQYATESQVQFGAPFAREVEKPPEVSHVNLPAGLPVWLELQTPVGSGSAVGDLLRARVAEDVKLKGRILVPAGALATGRIRRLEHNSDPEPYFSLGLEFTGVEWEHTRAEFYGDIQKMGPIDGFTWVMTFSKARSTEGLAPGSTYTSTTEHVVTRPLPGVAVFFVRGTNLHLSAGLRMLWKTRLP